MLNNIIDIENLTELFAFLNGFCTENVEIWESLQIIKMLETLGLNDLDNSERKRQSIFLA